MVVWHRKTDVSREATDDSHASLQHMLGNRDDERELTPVVEYSHGSNGNNRAKKDGKQGKKSS